jgi:hypothetical protein
MFIGIRVFADIFSKERNLTNDKGLMIYLLLLLVVFPLIEGLITWSKIKKQDVDDQIIIYTFNHVGLEVVFNQPNAPILKSFHQWSDIPIITVWRNYVFIHVTVSIGYVINRNRFSNEQLQWLKWQENTEQKIPMMETIVRKSKNRMRIYMLLVFSAYIFNQCFI